MTIKEREIIDWEFEELLRNIVLAYLKLGKFESFETSVNTYLKINEISIKQIYDIKITKRKWGVAENET